MHQNIYGVFPYRDSVFTKDLCRQTCLDNPKCGLAAFESTESKCHIKFKKDQSGATISDVKWTTVYKVQAQTVIWNNFLYL